MLTRSAARTVDSGLIADRSVRVQWSPRAAQEDEAIDKPGASRNQCPIMVRGRLVALPIAMRCFRVRKYRRPSDIAGDEKQDSPSELVASSSNVGPAFSTKTSPSSLVT